MKAHPIAIVRWTSLTLLVLGAPVLLPSGVQAVLNGAEDVLVAMVIVTGVVWVGLCGLVLGVFWIDSVI